ncbi:hypothetical protein K1T71_004217 [Dendrolimus kikuchii]|uniref:Uncharacterized protein n=1 Tax=Dendrolimus kikuchii TaxID=765133 RepID=A0ACC1DA58_9NEOP|nr:hypothetical protein K1T71_004217 [Dendrolimus kikuchii]
MRKRSDARIMLITSASTTSTEHRARRDAAGPGHEARDARSPGLRHRRRLDFGIAHIPADDGCLMGRIDNGRHAAHARTLYLNRHRCPDSSRFLLQKALASDPGLRPSNRWGRSSKVERGRHLYLTVLENKHTTLMLPGKMRTATPVSSCGGSKVTRSTRCARETSGGDEFHERTRADSDGSGRGLGRGAAPRPWARCTHSALRESALHAPRASRLAPRLATHWGARKAAPRAARPTPAAACTAPDRNTTTTTTPPPTDVVTHSHSSDVSIHFWTKL